MVAVAFAALLIAGCGGGKSQSAKLPDTSGSAEPDKVLYDRAMDDIAHGRQEIARLGLQTLINTYPDSEYLAKAKLAIADSYYKQGGTSGLTQACAEYKDFITFFPFLPEAAYAQMQAGMCHYKRMEKPDRDRTEARAAEDEFQIFLQKYPNDPLIPQVEQNLRNVQEVLAEGDFRIGRYYYIKGAYPAAAGRLLDLVDRYPLYSQADRALWMLGNAFEQREHGEIGAKYYARIVRDYPLSPFVPEAKAHLEKLGVPVPQPDPEALARMQQEQQMDRQRPGGFLHRPFGAIRGGPDTSMSARVGKPTMTAYGDTLPGSETLSAPGGNLSVGGTSGGATGNSAAVERVSPGAPESSAAKPPATTAAPSTSTPPGTTPATTPAPPAGSNPDPTVKPGTTNPAPPANARKKGNSKSDPKKDDSKKDKDESTSKKKKGLRRIIPW